MLRHEVKKEIKSPLELRIETLEKEVVAYKEIISNLGKEVSSVRNENASLAEKLKSIENKQKG